MAETPAVQESTTAAVQAAPAPVAENPIPTPQPSKPASPLGSPLFSLSSALETEYGTSQEGDGAEGSEASGQTQAIDESAEQKITAGKGVIISHIDRHRVRYSPFFDRMVVSQNQITIEVPSNDIADDARRLWSDIYVDVAAEIGVVGRIELNVVVKEEIKVSRPIRLDDKIVHFGNLNPAIQQLVEALALEVDA